MEDASLERLVNSGKNYSGDPKSSPDANDDTDANDVNDASDVDDRQSQLNGDTRDMEGYGGSHVTSIEEASLQPLVNKGNIYSDDPKSSPDDDTDANNANGDVDATDDVDDRDQTRRDTVVTIESGKPKRLYYKVSDNPALHVAFIFGLQQGLISVSGFLGTSLLVAETVCAKDDELVKSKLLSSTMFISGMTTALMVTVGVRLPVFQGPTGLYVIPLLALSQMEEWRCPTQDELAESYGNSSSNVTLDHRGLYPVPQELINHKLSVMMGSLMLVGVIHMLIGATGLVGVLLRFIGPVTIVPSMVLIGLYVYEIAVNFSETQWGVAISTCGLCLIFALYLRNVSSPFPVWSKKKGFHIVWFPFHQVFAILLAIIISWGLSAILTVTNAISNDPESPSFYARTDSRLYVIEQSSWFYFPYPGQFGWPSFSAAAFISFMIATIFSVLDSIGDYSACARMCFLPPPPTHAINRGIAVEGFMSFLAGAVGIGHGTNSYANNIGVIGLTKVASRRVFVATGVIFMVVAVVGKIGAFFVTIPYSIIGGSIIIGLGNYLGIVQSNLQYIDLNSARNLAIIGISLLVGLMLPFWVKKTPGGIQTGNDDVNHFIEIVLSNPSCVGGVLACFFDNTVPGTFRERGLHLWQQEYTEAETLEDKTPLSDMYEEGSETYNLPWIPKFCMRSKISRFIPVIPSYSKKPQHKN